MTEPDRTFVTGRNQPFMGAYNASIRRDRIEGLLLSEYWAYNAETGEATLHWTVSAMAGGLGAVVFDTTTQAEAQDYVATDPDGLLS